MLAEKLQNKVVESRFNREIDLTDESIRYEQIGNVIYLMATPSGEHEYLITEILFQFRKYLNGKTCQVFGSNIGLNLEQFIPILKKNHSFQEYFKQKNEEKKEQAFLLPDISVHCDPSGVFKSTSRGYPKLPKFIAEIYSPSTGEDDLGFKKDIYELIGVPEYWVIKDKKNIVVFILENGKYKREDYRVIEDEDILEVPVSVFPDLIIRFD